MITDRAGRSRAGRIAKGASSVTRYATCATTTPHPGPWQSRLCASCHDAPVEEGRRVYSRDERTCVGCSLTRSPKQDIEHRTSRMPATTQVCQTTTDHALFSSRQLSGARVDALAGRTTTTTTTRSIHRIPAIFVADVSRSQAPSREAFGPIRTNLSGPGSRKDRVVDGARMWQPQVPAGVVVVPGSSERQTGHFRGQRPCDRQIRGAPGPSSAVVPRRTGAQRALTFSFACSCEGVARRVRSSSQRCCQSGDTQT